MPVLLANSCFQKCVTAAENKISAIDGKALGMNFQLGSLYDARYFFSKLHNGSVFFSEAAGFILTRHPGALPLWPRHPMSTTSTR